MIKLIAIDLDDTLLNSKKEISAVNLAAIKKALAAGIKIVPATGRQINGLPPELTSINGITHALTSNGAKLWQLNPNKVIFSSFFPPAAARQVFQTLSSFICLNSVFCQNSIFCQKSHLKTVSSAMGQPVQNYIKTSRIAVENLQEVFERNITEIEKFSAFFANESERKTAIEELNKFEGISTTSSIEKNIEINTAEASKGNSLIRLAKTLGISPAQTMAIGDSGNDISMLKAAGIGVAMGNAAPLIKQYADFVSQTNDEDGVALAIEKALNNY